MSQSATSTPAAFVFGTPKGAPSSGETTKPVLFTFSTNFQEPSTSNPSTTQTPPRSTSPRVASSPPQAKAEEKPEERPETQNVKAALEELEHLQKERDASQDHEMRTAPLITREAYIAGGFANMSMQYGVVGEALSKQSNSVIYKPIVDSRLYMNTNAPFSVVVCGVQGSGKTHTVSVLLENMLIPNFNSIGTLSNPLAALVLHFGEGSPGSRPSEAAWVGVPSDANPHITTPPVRVYVSRASLDRMKAVYTPLGKHVNVMPLLFNESELDVDILLSLIGGTSGRPPWYMPTVLGIVRELRASFSYRTFVRRLKEVIDRNLIERERLEQCLFLLNSFVDTHSSQDSLRFAAGELTIVDLSDPFVDLESACHVFETVTKLFVRADVGTGKALVVDEAHKYVSLNDRVSGLSKTLLTLTREQRHLGMRVLISTQDPTDISPELLGLCTVVIVHRFSSQTWWDRLSYRVSAEVAFAEVVRLQTGEAIVLAPSGMGVFQDHSGTKDSGSTLEGEAQRRPLTLGQFGRRVILMKTRARVTKDGGASILSESESGSSK